MALRDLCSRGTRAVDLGLALRLPLRLLQRRQSFASLAEPCRLRFEFFASRADAAHDAGEVVELLGKVLGLAIQGPAPPKRAAS